MRHLVLALMILLLPLRGWTGDVMATQMASINITADATEKGASNPYEMGHKASFYDQKQISATVAAMFDCHEQAAEPLRTITTANSATGNEPCGTCQVCQACHTVALSPSPIEVMASFASPQLRPTPAAAFTSAASALGQKPPIS